MDKSEIGAVARPQGIKGELKIRLFGDGFEQVKDVTAVEIKGVSYKIENFNSCGGEEVAAKREEVKVE